LSIRIEMDFKKIKRDHFAEILFYYLIVLTLVYLLNLFNDKGQEVLVINGFHNVQLDFFFSHITELGNGLLFLPVIIVVAFKSYRLAILGTAVWAMHGLCCLVMKRVVFPDFKRPVALIDNSLLHFPEGVKVHYHYSFPSGHTATIFCLAVFVSLIYKNRLLSIVMIIVALVVGCSRIYLLQHFLEDVLAGAVLGSAISFSFYQYFIATKFPPWMNSNLSVLFRSGPKLSKPQNR
jgi:membrane-associated phospholipid phosphatase